MSTEETTLTGKSFAKTLKISGLQMSSKDFKKKVQKMREAERYEERKVKARKAERELSQKCG